VVEFDSERGQIGRDPCGAHVTKRAAKAGQDRQRCIGAGSSAARIQWNYAM